MDISKPVLLLSFFAIATAAVTKRQLPEGLECSLSDLTAILDRFPVDEMSGQSVCRNSVTSFIRIPPEEYVERQAEVLGSLSEICDAECLPHVVGVVDACFSSFRVSLAQACGSNGRFQCWQGAVINNGTGVFAACFTTVPGMVPSQCTDDCQDLLEGIRSELGCCVNNVFNTTVFGEALASLQVANGELWDSCGVNRIEFCPEPGSFSTESNVVEDPTSGASGQVLSLAVIYTVCLILAFLA